MCEVVDKVWDRLKALFGRSRTVLLNVIGLLGMAWTELGSDLMGLDWDVFFKHEVAVAIGIGMNILNLLVRLYTTSPVNFGALPSIPQPEGNVAPALPADPVAGQSNVEGQK